MIEYSDFENDVVKGAVWRSKTKTTCEVRIRMVWTGADDTARVSFDIWDRSDNTVAAWEKNGGTELEALLAEYEYARFHVLNEAREGAKVAYAIERTLSDLSDCMDVEARMEGRELAKRLVKLAKLSAGYDVLTHEWDEGCAGVGCCADTAEKAGDFLVDEYGVSEDELKGYMK